jgi:hypothetical protein
MVHDLDESTVQIFSRSRISLFLSWRFSSLQVAIGEAPRWSWINGLESWCIDGPDLFVNSHLAVPVMKGLITPSHDSRDSEMELHQRPRSKLDLTAVIESPYRISRFRISCCSVFVTPCRDSRNSDKELHQRSKSELDSTAVIESQFRISRFRISCCSVFVTPCRDSRNSDKELHQWSKSDLDLTIAVTSRFRISRYRDF